MRWTINTGCAFAAVFLLLVPSADAATVTFDFESETTGGYPSLTMTQSGVTVVIDRTSSSNFQVYNLGGDWPPSWGAKNILSVPTAADYFIANLSGTSIYGFTIDGGDFGFEAEQFYAEAWSGADASGSLLFSDSASYAATATLASPSHDFVTVGGAGSQAIGSIRFWSVGAGGQSAHWDNLALDTSPAASTVPVPAAAWLGLGMLAGLGAVRRLRRRR